MALVATEQSGGQRITCDVPACVRKRNERDQDNGRFLVKLSWGKATLSLTVCCPECGGTHTIILPIPIE